MPDKLISAQAAREFAHTYLKDPILEMAVNAVLDHVPAIQCEGCPMMKEVDNHVRFLENGCVK